MARVRRPRYLCFFFDDFTFLDVGSLLRGSVEPVTARQAFALSILRGEAIELTADEYELAASTPSTDWVEAVDEDTARALARKGVLLSDEDEPELEALRARHETLESTGWNLEASLYHFLSRWHGIDLRSLAGQDEASDLMVPTAEAVQAYVDNVGPPPRRSPPLPPRERSASFRSSSGRGSSTTCSCAVGRHGASIGTIRWRCRSSRSSSATSSGTTGMRRCSAR